MNVHRKLAIAALLVALATFSTARAQEKKIQRAELPPAVKRTLAEQSRGATIQGLSTEVEDEVSMASLPQAVKVALTKAAGAGTIEKVETLTKKGKLVAYEADVKTGTKHSEIQVGPDGKRLAHPE